MPMRRKPIMKPSVSRETPLPPFLHALFWEFNVKGIDIAQHADTIMGRIMERGNWQAMRWLRDVYHTDQIISYLGRRGKKVLPPREVNYWAFVSGVPEDMRIAWVSEARRRLHAWRKGPSSCTSYDYQLLQSTSVCRHGAKLAHADDIACMKLSAIGSRGSRKDFVDLHFMISQFRSLKEYLDLYQQKYQNRDIGHILRSLVYFQDAEAEPDIVTVHPFDWQGMKHDFERWVGELVR